MDEKTIQRIKKLQALAERGVGGEKTTAQKKLAKLLKDNGINSLDELQKEEYAREVGEADSDSKGIYRHAGEFRPPAHYRGQSRGLRRVSGSVQTVCRP